MIKLGSRRLFKKTCQIGGVLLIFTGVLYPIVISPMIDSSDYKKIQSESRKNIDQEKIQPGNMKIWSDPFKKKE